jgi:7-cyano-7-deazaguanine synthase
MADSNIPLYKSTIVPEGFKDGQGTAVLFSAGLDSAVLLAQAASEGVAVPIYVGVGLAWEDEERAMAARLLGSGRLGPNVRPVVALCLDMTDVYPSSHWAIRGEAPGFDTPDEDVYLEGRNLVLLSKAAVFMARAGLSHVRMGPLAGNPFPDATPQFFRAMESALSLGLNRRIAVETPFVSMHKSDVIRLGEKLSVPFELTLSCMQPAGGLHCGRCSKCRERRDAFVEAGVQDPTAYAVKPMR